MKKTIFTILGLMVAFYFANAKELTIKKLTAGTEITLDGDDSDWESITAGGELDQLKGANTTNTATFKMTYDDKFVYVVAKIQDEQMDTSQSKNVWEKDCIEVFFVFNDTCLEKVTTIDSSKYSYSNGQLGAWQLRKVWGRDMTDFSGKGFEAVEADISGGYCQEWKLPFDTLKSTGIWSGQKFMFEIQNGDNDGAGRDGQHFWNKASDDQWNTIKNQGVIILETPITAVKNIAKASSIKIKANSIEFAGTVKEVNVYNITGQLVLKAKNVNKVSTATLKTGTYFVVAGNEKAKFVK